jgi:hypothetical protein
MGFMRRIEMSKKIRKWKIEIELWDKGDETCSCYFQEALFTDFADSKSRRAIKEMVIRDLVGEGITLKSIKIRRLK